MLPLGGPPSRFLGRYYGALGALLGALRAVLGLSWASLGTLLGQLGAILKPRKAIGSEQARRQKTLIFLRFLKDFSLLGGLLGELFGHLEPSWDGLGASWSILGAILRHLPLVVLMVGPMVSPKVHPTTMSRRVALELEA